MIGETLNERRRLSAGHSVVGYASSRVAAIHVYDNAGKLIETHEQSDDFKERWLALYTFHKFLIPGLGMTVDTSRKRDSLDSVRDVETVV